MTYKFCIFIESDEPLDIPKISDRLEEAILSEHTCQSEECNFNIGISAQKLEEGREI